MPSGQLGAQTSGQPSTQPAARTEQPQKRQKPEQITRFHGRRRPFGQGFGPAQSSAPAQQPMDPTLRVISKLLLKHEATLSGLRQNKNFVLFFRQDERSLLPNLMQVSKEWHEKRAAGDMSLTSPLKTVLMGCLLKELLARLQRVASTEQGRESLRKAQWIGETGSWNYLKWSPKERRLILDEAREPMTHTRKPREPSALFTIRCPKTSIQHFSSNCPSKATSRRPSSWRLRSGEPQRRRLGPSFGPSAADQPDESGRLASAASGQGACQSDLRGRPVPPISSHSPNDASPVELLPTASSACTADNLNPPITLAGTPSEPCEALGDSPFTTHPPLSPDPNPQTFPSLHNPGTTAI